MKQFQFRFIDKLDFVVHIRARSLMDDFAAFTEAKQLCATHTIEVWDGDRLVTRVKKGNLPPRGRLAVPPVRRAGVRRRSLLCS